MTMINTDSHDEWSTPDYLYLPLMREFEFNYDLACTRANSKCSQGAFFDEGIDGLKVDFNQFAVTRSIWCNPPFGKGKMGGAVKTHSLSDVTNSLREAL